MNKVILTAAVAVMTLTGTMASAQPYGRAYGYERQYERGWRDSDRDGRPDAQEWNRDRDRDGRPDQYDRYDNRRDGYGARSSAWRDSDRDGIPDAREWNRDRDRDGRPDQYDRYDNRRSGYGYAPYRSAWREGQRYPYYGQRGYVIEDYRAYRLPPPRPGYRYYRGDNGDVVTVAIASGLIGAIIGGALSDNDHGHRR